MANTTKAESKYSLLETNLKEQLNWQQARIKCLVLMITAICKIKTVCFERLAEVMDSNAKVTSRHRRIQRFFADFLIDKDLIANFLFSLLHHQTDLTLSIDRTNWKFGKTDINIFMLSVCYDGMAMPVMWMMLPKKGNSNSLERIELIERFIRLFGKECIASVVADREFIGDKWLSWLSLNSIPFHIRIRDNMWFGKPNGELLKMSWILQGQKLHTIYNHPKMLFLDKNLVYVSGMKLRNNEYLIIVSYNKQEEAIASYKDRWQIETMFKAFKTNGFNVEDTHLSDLKRIDKLITLVSIAFIWAYKTGIHIHLNVEPIKLKKHGRKAYSFFKLGLRHLTDALSVHFHLFNPLVKLLSCT